MNNCSLPQMIMLTNLANSRYRFEIRFSIARHNYQIACQKGWPPSEIKGFQQECEDALRIIHDIDCAFVRYFIDVGRLN